MRTENQKLLDGMIDVTRFDGVEVSLRSTIEFKKYCSKSKLWFHLETSNCQILVTLGT